MSSSVDERIVSMVFDNRKFQSGVSESMDSINKLKSGLKFEGATNGLAAIDESAILAPKGARSRGKTSWTITKPSAMQAIEIIDQRRNLSD